MVRRMRIWHHGVGSKGQQYRLESCGLLSTDFRRTRLNCRNQAITLRTRWATAQRLELIPYGRLVAENCRESFSAVSDEVSPLLVRGTARFDVRHQVCNAHPAIASQS